MGSTNASGISVVNKYTSANVSYVKHSRRIKSSTSENDATSVLQVDAVTRPIGSGSIVSQDGSVAYTETKVVGMIMPGRQVDERIASTVDASRSLSVDLAGNKTAEVIPTSLSPHTPQVGVKSTGGKVVVSNVVDGTSTRKDN